MLKWIRISFFTNYLGEGFADYFQLFGGKFYLKIFEKIWWGSQSINQKTFIKCQNHTFALRSWCMSTNRRTNYWRYTSWNKWASRSVLNVCRRYLWCILEVCSRFWVCLVLDSEVIMQRLPIEEEKPQDFLSPHFSHLISFQGLTNQLRQQ